MLYLQELYSLYDMVPGSHVPEINRFQVYSLKAVFAKGDPAKGIL